MTRWLERLFRWAGGAAFAASAAFCAYTYLVVWARAARFEPRAVAIDAALFAAFASHHSVFAREGVKRLVAYVVAERLIRSVYVWTASVLLALVCAWWRPIGGEFYDRTGWWAAIHAGVQLAGLAVIGWSLPAIDAFELAGVRSASDAKRLRIRGPYGWVRHPLYLGWLLATFGAARMTGDRFAFALASAIYVVAAVRWEERSLAQSFGAPYVDYRHRVRWRLVPYVY